MQPLTLIALIAWLLSFFGLAAVVLKKLPVLAVLPEPAANEAKKEKQNSKIRFLSPSILKQISVENLLHKSLLRIHVTILKAENKTAALLEHMRRKSEKKEGTATVRRQDGYWQNLKKPRKKNSPA